MTNNTREGIEEKLAGKVVVCDGLYTGKSGTILGIGSSRHSIKLLIDGMERYEPDYALLHVTEDNEQAIKLLLSHHQELQKAYERGVEDQLDRESQNMDAVIAGMLQKALEEEKMSILKLALSMGDCPINNPDADAGWMKFQHDFCLKLTKDNKEIMLSENDQSELDQPPKKSGHHCPYWNDDCPKCKKI